MYISAQGINKAENFHRSKVPTFVKINYAIVQSSDRIHVRRRILIHCYYCHRSATRFFEALVILLGSVKMASQNPAVAVEHQVDEDTELVVESEAEEDSQILAHMHKQVAMPLLSMAPADTAAETVATATTAEGDELRVLTWADLLKAICAFTFGFIFLFAAAVWIEPPARPDIWRFPPLVFVTGWFLLAYWLLLIIQRGIVHGKIGFCDAFWICNMMLPFCAAGCLLHMPLLLSTAVVVLLFEHATWYIDVISRLLCGCWPIGSARYLTDSTNKWSDFVTTSHHVWFMPLILTCLYQSSPVPFSLAAFALNALVYALLVLLSRLFVPFKVLEVNSSH